MIVGVGTKNEAKVGAVRGLLSEYPFLAHAKVVGREVPSGVSAQPLGWDEIMRGAKNRAKGACEGYDFGFGIESGLIPVPHTKTGLMDVCACAIYDGQEFHLGISSGFEVPFALLELMQVEKLELNEAFKKANLPTNPNVFGVIESLTNGRVDRIAFTQQAIRNALIHLEHPMLYRRES
jgi:inosine/xanthosine triphosphatase